MPREGIHGLDAGPEAAILGENGPITGMAISGVTLVGNLEDRHTPDAEVRIDSGDSTDLRAIAKAIRAERAGRSQSLPPDQASFQR